MLPDEADLGDRVDADRQQVGASSGWRRRRRGTPPGGPAPSTSRPGSGSRSRRRRRRCARPPSGSPRRPRCGRARRPARPAFSRSSASVAPWRPAEYSTASAGMRLPLASCGDRALRRAGSTPTTASPKRKVTPRSRRWYCSASTICASQNSSRRWRCSMTVTRMPSAANIEAYSMPITPAPTTTIVVGMRSSCRMPSESRIVRSSNVDVLRPVRRACRRRSRRLGAVSRRSSPSPRGDGDGVRVDEAALAGDQS